jgi:hypothetical protein
MVAQQQHQQQQQSPTRSQPHHHHEQQQQEHIQHAQAVRTSVPVSPLTITTASTPIDPAREGLLIDHHHHRHQASVDSIEGAAEAAMITDGYRGPAEQSHQQQQQQHHHQHNAFAHTSIISSAPPPYVPGESSRFMTGHTADDNNEMRLSDYVKGQTRAQDMKDGGAGL